MSSMLRYECAGPVLSAFHKDPNRYRVIQGPIGSGKSSACCVEMVKRATEQRVYEGWRRSRWAVLRATYSRLESTTLDTWKNWFPQVPVRLGAPMVSRMTANRIDPETEKWDGTLVDLQVMFLALDRPEDAEKVRGLELTGVWINEISEFPERLVFDVLERLGRYPSKEHGGSNWSGMVADTNLYDTDHWLYDLTEVKKPTGWGFHWQPGGLIRRVTTGGDVVYINNPVAENMHHIDRGYQYYRDLIPGKDEGTIDTQILSMHASTFSGKPVYHPFWRVETHVAKEPLQIYRGLPVVWGVDPGMMHALLAGQVTPRGQVRVLREFPCADGGLLQHCQAVVLPAVAKEFRGMTMRSWSDPTAKNRGQADETTCFEILNRFGFNAEPAPTNDPTIRREAVIQTMQRLVDGQPGLIVDPSCHMLIKAHSGGYQFKRIPCHDGKEAFRVIAEKNEYSHIADALQYLILGEMTLTGQVADSRNVVLPKPQSVWAGRV